MIRLPFFPATLVLLALAMPELGSAGEAAERPGPGPDAPAPIGRRPDAARTTVHADLAIQRALAVVGQPLNPVMVVGADDIGRLYARAPGVGALPIGLDAFRAPGDAGDPRIYINRDSPLYTRAARTRSRLARLALAATLVHEQVHNSDREVAARRLQADFVRARLSEVPWSERDAARRYLGQLEARAAALAHAERRSAARLVR